MKETYNTHRSMRGDGSGFLCLAGPYDLGGACGNIERRMLDRVIADMVRGGIAHELRCGEYAGKRQQTFVWRTIEGYLFWHDDEAKKYTSGDEADERFARRRCA